jgi:hypothetical protein
MASSPQPSGREYSNRIARFFGILATVLPLSGVLDRLHLGDLLEWLNLTRASGRLSLASPDVVRTFDVVHGHVAFASSSRAAERLASWLLRKGYAPRQALLRALATSQIQGLPFTDVVMRTAFVEQGTLRDAGRALATALASRVLRETRVSFRFDPGWPVSEHLHVDLELECSKLIMQAAYVVDTLPPPDAMAIAPPTSLEPEAIETLFWSVTEDLEGELLEAGALAASHRALLSVGEVLQRWVTHGPPLLPLSLADIERIRGRLAAGEAVTIEDSPTFTWDLLSLVNGLDAPGFQHSSSLREAWLSAGEDAPRVARLLIETDRWIREWRSDSDESLRRAARARVAAGGRLARAVGLDEDTARAAAVLPVVLLELVATALMATPLSSGALRRAALQRLLPVLGRAAGAAAGLPEVLIAALTGEPVGQPGARLAALAALAAGDAGLGVVPGGIMPASTERRLASTMRAARRAAEKAAEQG